MSLECKNQVNYLAVLVGMIVDSHMVMRIVGNGTDVNYAVNDVMGIVVDVEHIQLLAEDEVVEDEMMVLYIELQLLELLKTLEMVKLQFL